MYESVPFYVFTCGWMYHNCKLAMETCIVWFDTDKSARNHAHFEAVAMYVVFTLHL